ncbi:MAG: flippase [Candidatus Woesearchaeota archaeon]
MVELTQKYLIRQGLWIYLFTFLAAPLGYLIRILYARTLSVEEFGLIYSIIGFIALISIFNDLGFSETLNYYATRFYEKKQYGKVKGSFIFALMMQAGTGILLGILFWVLAPWLAENYFKSEVAINVLRAFIMYFFFFNLSNPLIQFYVATHNYLFLPLSEFIRSILIFTISFLIIFYYNNIILIALVWGISYFILFFVYIILLNKYYPKIINSKSDLSFILYKKLLKYSLIIVGGIGAIVILSKIDIIIITYFLDLKEVAYYSVAYSLASILFISLSPILNIFFPLTSKLTVKNNHKQISIIFNKMYKWGTFIALPCLIIFLSFPKEILILLYGYEYAIAHKSLILLTISSFFVLLNYFNSKIMAGLGLVKQRTIILYIGSIINLILNLSLVKNYGIVGVSFATMFSFAIIWLLSLLVLLKKCIKVKMNFKKVINLILINIMFYFVVYFLKYIINTNIYIKGIIVALISGLVYLLLGHLFYDNFLRSIKRIIKIKDLKHKKNI